MAKHDEEQTRRLQLREVGGVTILVTGPGAARVAVIFAALVPRLSGSDRASLGGLVLVMTDPEAKARRKALEGNWAFSTTIGGTNTILLRRQIEHLPDAALAFLIAHEAAHLVHYGRGELDHEEVAAERLAASWGGPTIEETWRAFRDNWIYVPPAERDGIPAWGESAEVVSRGPS